MLHRVPVLPVRVNLCHQMVLRSKFDNRSRYPARESQLIREDRDVSSQANSGQQYRIGQGKQAVPLHSPRLHYRHNVNRKLDFAPSEHASRTQLHRALSSRIRHRFVSCPAFCGCSTNLSSDNSMKRLPWGTTPLLDRATLTRPRPPGHRPARECSLQRARRPSGGSQGEVSAPLHPTAPDAPGSA
jgi:hypothetical protein